MYLIVVGTRPEIIKMAPIVKACQRYQLPFRLVHTEQHYDYNLSTQFFEELALPTPDYSLQVGSGSHAEQTAKALVALEQTMLTESPSVVLVEGDTNTVLAAGLAAVKVGIPIGHVEAGLRSYDLRMPEEHNRRVIDHLSTHLFAPTVNQALTLEAEQVWGQIYITGNTVIDACLQNLRLAKERFSPKVHIPTSAYALMTMHRPENVDNVETLRSLVTILSQLPIPTLFLVHPRTQHQLCQHHLWSTLMALPQVTVLPPVGYFDFLNLMQQATMILTDSGGIQEEATAPNIRTPVLILRASTERPEAVTAGFAKLVGVHPDRVCRAVDEWLAAPPELPRDSPFGDGHAGETIIAQLERTEHALPSTPRTG